MTHNNLFGFLALATYIATLIPSNIVKIFPHTKKWEINRYLLKHRRFLGLTAFALATNHALNSIAQYNINFLRSEAYIHYYTGVASLIIFAILAFTSNNWSIRQLKQKWKFLHRLTYIAMFLVFWHILSLMESSWTFLTPIALYLMSIISLMFLTRLAITGVKVVFSERKIKDETLKSLPKKFKKITYDEIEVS